MSMATDNADLINRVYGTAITLNWDAIMPALGGDAVKEELVNNQWIVTFKDGSKAQVTYGEGVTLKVIK